MPENVDIVSHLPWLMMNAPEASEEVCLDALRRSVREFLRDTLILTEEVQASIVPGQSEYSVAATWPGMVVYRIDSMKRGVSTIDPLLYRYVSDTGKLVLEDDLLSTADEWTADLVVVLAPQLGYGYAPKWIMDRWGERIVDGAVGELAMMQKKPWSNPQLGYELRRQYRGAVADARSEKIRRGVQTPQIIRG